MTTKTRRRTTTGESGPAPTTSGHAEIVNVVVVVNHDDLKRGDLGEVHLDDRVRRLLDRGYLKLADEAQEYTLVGTHGGRAEPGSLLGVSTPTAAGPGGVSDVEGGPDHGQGGPVGGEPGSD